MATKIQYRRTGIRIPVGTRYILPTKRPILPLGFTQTTVQWVPWLFAGGKTAGGDVNLLPPPNAEVKE